MNLDDFVLERGIFQFKYAPSYLVWQNSGGVWNDVSVKWPKLKRRRVDSEVSAFTLDNKYDFALALESASIDCQLPTSDLADFIEKVAFFVHSITEHLDIHEYSRVGLRLLYRRFYEDKDGASKGFFETKLLSLPEGPHFGIKGSFSFPEFACRWETESMGATIRVKAEGRKIDFDPPAMIPELTAIHDEKFAVVYDVDFYTNGLLTVGQFRTEDWIKNALHLVRRDSRKFLGG